MAEKSADIQTLAPRLSYVEDKLDWVAENAGGGGTDPSPSLRKLWDAAMFGAESGAWSSQPWAAEDLIYGMNSPNGVSMHLTVFGTDVNNALTCQDGKGFYGWTYRSTEARWKGSSQYTLSTEIFDETENGYVDALRTAGRSLVSAIFKDASYIGSFDQDTIIGRIEQLVDDLEALATNAQSEIARLDARIDALS